MAGKLAAVIRRYGLNAFAPIREQKAIVNPKETSVSFFIVLLIDSTLSGAMRPLPLGQTRSVFFMGNTLRSYTSKLIFPPQ